MSDEIPIYLFRGSLRSGNTVASAAPLEVVVSVYGGGGLFGEGGVKSAFGGAAFFSEQGGQPELCGCVERAESLALSPNSSPGRRSRKDRVRTTSRPANVLVDPNAPWHDAKIPASGTRSSTAVGSGAGNSASVLISV